MGLFSDPPDDTPVMWHETEEGKATLAAFNSDLYREIQVAGSDLMDENAGDYGEGGWHSYPAIDEVAIHKFIEARERRMLDGMTLVEFVEGKK